jgi:membrane protein required for colicin V production
MNIADYLVIAAVLLSAIVGIVRGFLREAIALGTWIVALFVAWHFSDMIEPHLGGLLAANYVRPWAARVIIVALILLFGAALGAIVSHYVRLSIFSGMDRFLGFLFGAARGVVLIGVFVILAQLLKLDGELWWRHSTLIPYGDSVANGLRVLVGAASLR